jgi:ethanolamine utilization protein EutA
MSQGPAPVHDHDHELAHPHGHDGEPLDAAVEAATADAIWRVDNVELTTVGVDVGSATSHLMFSYVHLRRQAQGYSSRFVVVERRILHRSEILLTPYQADGLIDAERLEAFIAGAYRDAGMERDDVDAGAVILTGVALERANSRRIAELFASEGGRFVCASAGHNLESLLAAHGSGSVARSAEGGTVLNVDIGGGTTKLALCVDGQVAATMALWGGARLLVLDDAGRVERLEPPLADLAAEVGVEVEVGQPMDAGTLDKLSDAIASRIVAAATGDATVARLAGELPVGMRPDRIVVSGGVAEYLGETPGGGSHGDLGPRLAAAVRARFDDVRIPIEAATERIRATVIGASQFTLQVSGNTIHLSGEVELPMHNIPVVAIKIDDEDEVDAAVVSAMIARRAGQLDLGEHEGPVAVAVSWSGEPRYAQLRALADGVAAAHRESARATSPIILVLEADVAASMGSILSDDVGIRSPIVAIDGIELSDLDFIDLGERILPANVVPVVIKSLVFPHAGAMRPRILGSA